MLTARDSSHTLYYQFGTSMRSTKIRHDGFLKMTNAKNRNYTIEAKLKRFKCIKYEYSGITSILHQYEYLTDIS